MGIILILMFIQTEYGYLTVNSDSLGLTVYVDGDSIGTTIISKYLLVPGKYTVSIFPEDSFDVVYDQIKRGGITRKLSGILELAKYDAGSRRVEITPNTVVEVFISKKEIDSARSKAKRSLFLWIGSVFVTGLISGAILVQIL